MRKVQDIADYAAMLYHNGEHFPLSVEKALNEFHIDFSERKKIRSEVCSLLGKRGVKKKYHSLSKKGKYKPWKKWSYYDSDYDSES